MRRTRPRTRARRSSAADRRSDRAAARRARAARRSRGRRSGPTPGPRSQGGRRARRAYLAQWDGCSTCPTSRRLAEAERSAAGGADAPADARGVRRPAAPARAVIGAADRDPVRRAALDDPVRAAGHGQDDAGADAGGVRRRRVRGAVRGPGRPRRGARGDGAGARAPPGRPAHDLLPRRDPPLQQGPAGRAAARRRGRARGAGGGDDREPVLRGQLGADLAHAGLRAARADAGGHRAGCCGGRSACSARPSRTR